jgi:hypothetical protein
MEEVSWSRNLKVLWLREGDKCTKFFHTIANSNKRRNSIDYLLIDGTMSTNWSKISEHIVQFYQRRFTEQLNWRLVV